MKTQKNDAEWTLLIKAAKSRLHHRVISPFVEAGNVAAAIMTDQGNIYTGVCIDTSCSLGMCAERNAVANMITCGESRITRLVCIKGNDIVGSPCGSCRELLMQLDRNSGDIEILTDQKNLSSVKLKQLVPDWWAEGLFETVENWNWLDRDDDD